MALTKVSYSMINTAPNNVCDYGAVGDGSTDDTAAIQAAFTAGGIVQIPNGTFKITTPITIGSAVKGVIWNGKVVSHYAGVQDTNVYPSVIFSSFSGFVDGLLHLEYTTSAATTTSDGVQFLNCNGLWVSGIKLKNQRFGVIASTSSNFHIGYIDADTMRGWQGSLNDNGGSIITLAGCERGRIDEITGTNIYKAAVYFSVDGVSGDNTSVHIGNISVSLYNPTRAVANGLTLRSAVDVSVETLTTTGGIAGLFCSREETTYNVDQIKIGKIYVEDNTDVSSNSMSVYVAGEATNPVGTIEIGEIYAKNSYLHSLFISYVDNIYISSFRSVTPSGRAILVTETNGAISIENCYLYQAAQEEILVSSGTTSMFRIGSAYVSRGTSALDPIKITVDTVKIIDFGDIVDLTPTPAYSALIVAGAPANTVDIMIKNVTTAATYAASVRAATFDKIKGGRFFHTALPADSTWPLGTEIYKTSPTSGATNSWVLTTTGFKATANLA